MADIKRMRFQWNYSHSVIIRRKGFNKEFMREVGRIMASHMDKYVPYGTKYDIHMANRVTVAPRNESVSIQYKVPYANKQYNGPATWNRDTSYHPLATSYWDKACWTNERTQILAEINTVREAFSVGD